MNSLDAPPVGLDIAERRSATACLQDVEWREEDGKLEFRGLAAVFDSSSRDLGGFVEKIQRGSFRSVLDKNPDVVFLGFQHDPRSVMARTSNGTLGLSETPRGLEVRADLAPTTQAKDLRILVKRGDVSEMSFGFKCKPGDGGRDSWSENEGVTTRTIHSFSDLVDVSTVVGAAYAGTTTSMRALVCGEEIVSGEGQLDEERLVALAWRIQRSEVDAGVEERAALDVLFAKTDTVSPWAARRALAALEQHPELAHDPNQGVAVDVAFRVAARRRRLGLRAA